MPSLAVVQVIPAQEKLGIEGFQCLNVGYYFLEVEWLDILDVLEKVNMAEEVEKVQQKFELPEWVE
jgi:hypothetical protein